MIYENEEDKLKRGLVSSELDSGLGLAKSKLQNAPLQQRQQAHGANVPAPQQKPQNSTKDFAKMMAGKVAQKYITQAATAKALGTAAGGPAGFMAATAAQHLAPELIGMFFRHGGIVRYYNNGGAAIPMNQGGSMVLPPPGAEQVDGVPQEVLQMADQVIDGQMDPNKFQQILMSMNVPQNIIKDVMQFIQQELMKRQQGGQYGS